ncbi:MAG TPA: hypothetical protein VFN37_04935 [Candidatus Baltobacteraceae bacterium]|nr:hypothetical protein [Candidatus Baltobacteraceae bacterium]
MPLSAIRERMPQAPRSLNQPGRTGRFAVGAAVAAAAALSIIPLISPAVMQGLETRYRAALQALGGIAPPPAPRTLISQFKSETVTLAQAQSRVSFTIVPPGGLPKDVVSSKIVVAPTGILNTRTHSWSVGPQEVTFWYRRANGRAFTLVADRYDAHGERPGEYVFEPGGIARNGRPILIKHRHYAWRTGDQQMLATQGTALRAAEIFAIQSAMHGTPVRMRPLHSPDTPATRTLRVLMPPT